MKKGKAFLALCLAVSLCVFVSAAYGQAPPPPLPPLNGGAPISPATPGTYTFSGTKSGDGKSSGVHTNITVTVGTAKPHGIWGVDTDGDGIPDEVWQLWKQHVTVEGDIDGWKIDSNKPAPPGAFPDPSWANEIYSTSPIDFDHPNWQKPPLYDKSRPIQSVCFFNGKKDVNGDGIDETSKLWFCGSWVPGETKEECNHAGNVHVNPDGWDHENPDSATSWEVHTTGVSNMSNEPRPKTKPDEYGH